MEIAYTAGYSTVALRKESVDRNRACTMTITICTASLSARRAWIEIEFPQLYEALAHVALRKESVDRNLWWGVRKAVGSLVALRKESVDRNRCVCFWLWCKTGSLSARRAWIEMDGD